MQGKGPITVWINSPGGDCIAASQIYAMLMDYPGDVTVKVDGLAASAASVIAMAGTKVLMAPTAMLMIHNPITAAFGDTAEMQKAIDMLAEVKESIINASFGLVETSLFKSALSHSLREKSNATSTAGGAFPSSNPSWKAGRWQSFGTIKQIKEVI